MASFHSRYDVMLPGASQLPVKIGWIDMMMDERRK